jgi:dolichol-phosphate mannosyltransferase/undecaprenyl-phosphate 4-deoxy-4-formamido-L-arabinose transferase
MDDDLQNPPEQIPKLIRALETQPDMDGILGVPEQKKHGIWRRLGSMLMEHILRITVKKPVHLKTSNFRLLKRELVNGLIEHKTNTPVMGPMIIQASQKLANVDVEHHLRRSGKSNYSLAALIRLSLEYLLNYSVVPLRFISIVGVLSSSLSACLGIFYLVRYLFAGTGSGVAGWTTLVLLIIFYSGLILFSVGLIGENLIRIIREVSGSPRYIIREEL